MNKNEFVDKVYTKSGLTKKDCKLCLDVIVEVIKEALKNGESVTLSNFGRFSLSEIKAKSMYDFKTKETTYLQARKTPKFKPSENLKQTLRQ
ncbi:MAG: HU family DNA-binding protein [Clostridia bacterium]|nr:HU family DNA-binding protein [Clostridia bacterium]